MKIATTKAKLAEPRQAEFANKVHWPCLIARGGGYVAELPTDLAKSETVSADDGANKVRGQRRGVGVRLAQALDRGDIDQITAASGVSRRSISRILRGEPVKHSTLVALAAACRVSVDWLERDEGPMECVARDSMLVLTSCTVTIHQHAAPAGPQPAIAH